MSAELGRLKALRVLNLENNLLIGTLPAELGSLVLVRVLNLANNRLAGTLPTNWGKQMSALSQLRLNDNNIQASPALHQIGTILK